MRQQSLFEMLQFPIKILFIGIILLGMGNLLTNSVFEVFWKIQNPMWFLFGEAMVKIGGYLVIYFPFYFLLRLVLYRTNITTTLMMGLVGYISFLVFTMFFSPINLPNTATYPSLGIMLNTSRIPSLASRVSYPLQTGLIATIAITISTRIAFSLTRNKSSYGFFGFVDRDVSGLMLSIVFACGMAWLVSNGWPLVITSLTNAFKFIASDISNPINMFTYGILERVLSATGIGQLIKQPFWFGELGGTTVNMVGESIAGDVNIWTSLVSQSLIPQSAGRFITPYYVLNLFAIPGMLIAMYMVNSDKIEKRRIRLFFVLAILVSMFTGILLPLEIVLMLVCPMLFVFHILFTGSLYGMFAVFKINLGFSYSGSTMTALPGTLMEFMVYVKNPNYSRVIQLIAIIGAFTFLIYFIVTSAYFNYLAIDLFSSGSLKHKVLGTIKAVGGIENIKMIHASMTRLTIQVFDPRLVDVGLIRSLGASKITETRAGMAIDYGAGSTMIKRGIEAELMNDKRV